MVLEAKVVLCLTELDFFKEIFLLPKWGKWPKIGQNDVFLNLLEYLSLIFSEFGL